MGDNKLSNKIPHNDVKKMISKLRGENLNEYEEKNNKTLNTHELLRITRSLNEEEKPSENKKNAYDQEYEEKKLIDFVGDLNVNIKFRELEVYDDYVYWGGVIDGIIAFVYRVTPDENTKGVRFDYLEGFSPDNPEYKEIIDKIENYFDVFYDYWSEVIQK
ncbi:MAG: hypothetical protein ACOC2U_00635 [bacterium]